MKFVLKILRCLFYVLLKKFELYERYGVVVISLVIIIIFIHRSYFYNHVIRAMRTNLIILTANRLRLRLKTSLRLLFRAATFAGFPKFFRASILELLSRAQDALLVQMGVLILRIVFIFIFNHFKNNAWVITFVFVELPVSLIFMHT